MNLETFKTINGYPLQENVWNLLNWDYYLVWDKYQAEVIQRSTGGHGKVIEVGPIWFSTSNWLDWD